MIEKAKVAIVGAGIAGASVAYHLAQAGGEGILLLERETLPGTHASGRSAALVRQSVEDAVNLRLAVQSARFYEDPPPGFEPRPEFRRTGSLLLACDARGLERLDRLSASAIANGLEARRIGVAEAVRLLPLLAGSPVRGALHCPSDGVIDVHALLQGFLRGALFRGVRLLAGLRVEEIRTAGAGRLSLATSAGPIEAESVVVAAGAWAGALAPASSPAPPLRPTRRHLFVTERVPGLDPRSPYAWDVGAPFYFRPESGGLLLCACDEADAPDCDEGVDPSIEERVAEGATRLLPSLGSRGIARRWAGLRTLTPDGRFVLGPDSAVRGLFWVAGLGGHGVTCAPAVGRIAADLILRGETDFADAPLLSPARFG